MIGHSGGKVEIWNLAQHRLEHTIHTLAGDIYWVGFDPADSGKTRVACLGTRGRQVWTLGSPLPDVDLVAAAKAAWDPRGGRLVVSDMNGGVALWMLDGGARGSPVRDYIDCGCLLAPSPVEWGGSRTRPTIWTLRATDDGLDELDPEPARGEILRTVSFGCRPHDYGGGPITWFSRSPSGRFVAWVRALDRKVRISGDGRILVEDPLRRDRMEAVWAPRSDTLAWLGVDRTRYWRAGQPGVVAASTRRGPTAVCWISDDALAEADSVGRVHILLVR